MDTFIALIPLLIIYLACSVGISIGQPCPLPQVYHEGYCYRLWGSTPRNFADAQSACVTSGGQLASVPNIRVHELVKDLIRAYKGTPAADGDIWIGLSWSDPLSTYTWLDGSKSQYRKWLVHGNPLYHQPLRDPASGGCVVIYHRPQYAAASTTYDYNRFTWGDESCTTLLPYVCVYDPPTPTCQRPLVSGYWAVDVIQNINTNTLSGSANETAPWSVLGTKDLPAAWVPYLEDVPGVYLQVKLDEKMIIREIWTQGRFDDTEVTTEWTTLFYLYYSDDGATWIPYYEFGGRSDKAMYMVGNYDRDTVKKNVFQKVIRAQYVRIYPVGYNNSPALRFELMGCPTTDENLDNSFTTHAQTGSFERIGYYMSKSSLIAAQADLMTDKDAAICKVIPTASFHTHWSFQVTLSLTMSLPFLHVLVIGKGMELGCRQRANSYAELRPIIRINTHSPSHFEYCDFIGEIWESNNYDFTCHFFCTCGRYGGGPCTSVVLDVSDTPDIPAAQSWAICEVAVFHTQ